MNNLIIENAKAFAKETLAEDTTGHDYAHIERVHKISKHIASKENANTFIVELAAILHDIADWKFHDGDLNKGPEVARDWLSKFDINIDDIEHICLIIAETSFKGAGEKSKPSTLEGQVVQDADRLDALGAIGIGRTFAYGGHKGRPMHVTDIEPEFHEDFAAYQKSNGTTINHFYEKLLLLKDRMNTKTGKLLAQERHAFLENFLSQFLKEWG